MKKQRIKILFASYECAPFFKRGGLGDVALGLPKALSDLGHEVRVIIPKYRDIDAKKWKIKLFRRNVPVVFGGKKDKINIYRTNLPRNRGTILFIDHPIFKVTNIFDKKSMERYVFFSKCILDFIRHEGWRPDIIHANDWHTGALFIYLKKLKKQDPWYKKIGSLYTIHNLAFQGVGALDEKKYGIAKSDLINNKQFNLMSEGILGSDLVNTVSRTYAKEILTKEYGQGLQKFLSKRKAKLYGIVNGLDDEYFNPAADRELPVRYDLKSMKKKELNKSALQKEVKLPSEKVAIISIISRLDNQKGFDLINEVMPKILAKYDVQFVAMGHGSENIAKTLQDMEKKNNKKMRALTFFGSAKLAKMIYAGSDIFLMPSRFEPCGLGQLIAMRYGTVPVVRRTGGLNDTVSEVTGKNKISGTGFTFKQYKPAELQKAIKKAIGYYEKPALWKKIQANGMKYDSTWKKSAKKYIELYNKITKKL